jgi:UDP-N-acetyl-2-amino-2-deoxyglucuronate dehydrogenase
MKRFAMTGASGYIAPRHLKAIKDTGNTLIAALDPFDSVGILDSYFPESEFFTQPEVFTQFLDNQRRQGKGMDYFSICSPNHLHDPHIRMALWSGADAICEKPIVLHPEDIRQLQELEQETGRRVWTVLQLRTHAALVSLKAKLDQEASGHQKEIVLSYITSRGSWYLRSWKGRLEQSGGLATNIGVHLFDMLCWLFGDVQHVEIHERSDTVASGYLELERARVRWFLSINLEDVPKDLQAKGQRTYRSITLDGQEVEFSDGFTELHNEVYRRTLTGQGFGLEDTYQAIATVAKMRHSPVVKVPAHLHPFLVGRL